MSSVFGTILSQTAANITALNLTGVTVYNRKRFLVHERDDQPAIYVVPQTESEGEEGFEEVLEINYPVLIGIVYGTGSVLGGTSETNVLTARQAVRRALRSVKAILVPEAPCVNVRMDLDPPFDRAAFRDNLDVSAMIVTYTVQEPRNV